MKMRNKIKSLNIKDKFIDGKRSGNQRRYYTKHSKQKSQRIATKVLTFAEIYVVLSVSQMDLQ